MGCSCSSRVQETSIRVSHCFGVVDSPSSHVILYVLSMGCSCSSRVQETSIRVSHSFDVVDSPSSHVILYV